MSPPVTNNQEAPDIEFRGVFKRFLRPSGDAYTALRDLNLTVQPGEFCAVVGPTGCGKSTTLNLHLRFIDPERGRISLDGHDISRVTLRSLREQVSKLSQFPFFMKDTIRENVRMGRQGASDAEVEEACKLAHIHEVIVDPNQIPLGYDTIVDVQVPSGGQKRLIALARCLLRRPEVLLNQRRDLALEPGDCLPEDAGHQPRRQAMTVDPLFVEIAHRIPGRIFGLAGKRLETGEQDGPGHGVVAPSARVGAP